MKLLRFGQPGHERPGLLDPQGQIRSLEGVVPDIAGKVLSAAGLRQLQQVNWQDLPQVEDSVRYGPCVAGVGKFICIGLNYADHAAESGMPLPPEPVLFMKATSAISGPHDDVVIPGGAQKVDWEVELGVVIGEVAKNVPVEEAMQYVAGYCVVNDLSERQFQLEMEGQWVKGKSCDSFGPIGPWLVTQDEVADPQQLGIWLEVDGHRYQDGNTKTMVYGVAYLVSYISRFMSLHPGDVISTGTPPGVGLGQDPPTYLRAGQTIRLGIEGLGTQQQLTVNEK